MAGKKAVQCIGPSYPLADRKAGVQRAINLQLRQIETSGEPNQFVLESSPGLLSALIVFWTVRSLLATDSRFFYVANDGLYEVPYFAGFFTLPVLRGTLATSTGFVSMKDGETQLVLSDGTNGYVLDLLTNVFTQITDDYWRGTGWIESMDGYFIFNAPGTNQFYISDIDNALTGDPLDFSSADATPDIIITHRVLKHELLLFGRISTEVWIDSGDADFPFARYNSVPIDVGIVGVRAAARTTDSVVWVGRTLRGQGYVYILEGHQPIRISNSAVEEALAASTDLTQCSTYSYHDSGSEFVSINAPGMATTWVYDLAIKQWHERAELVDGSLLPYPVDQMVFFAGKQYGSRRVYPSLSGGLIWELSQQYTAITLQPMIRERTWPHLIQPSLEPVSYAGLELACTTGQNVSAPANITLEISNDGGYTWGPPLLRSLGAVGRWMQRVRWLMLGTSRDRVFRLRCTDDVQLTIHSATVDAAGG